MRSALLPDAKSAEDFVENILDVHAPDEVLQRAGSGAQVYRGDRGRQRVLLPGIPKSTDLVKGVLDRELVSSLSEHRCIERRSADPIAEQAPDSCHEIAKSLA